MIFFAKTIRKPVKKRDELSTLLSKRARTEKKIILEAPAYSGLIKAFDYLENCNRRIFNHGWVNFPLAYTQASQFSITNLFQYFIFAGVLISKLIKTWIDEIILMYMNEIWPSTFINQDNLVICHNFHSGFEINSQYFWKWIKTNYMKMLRQVATDTKS